MERSQKTDLEEFYLTIDLNDFEPLREELGYWQHPHGAFTGKTPSQVYSELSDKTSLQEAVCAKCDFAKERIQMQNYHSEMQLRKLKLHL